jgi:hypothetical protein
VEPKKAGQVLARAAELAKEAPEPTQEAETSPAAQESQESVPEQPSGKRRGRPKGASAVKTPEWMRDLKKKHKEQVAAKAKEPKVEKKHVRQAAKEAKAEKEDRPLQRTLAEMHKMLEALASSAYPDVMRSFVSILAGAWWRGDATDKEVIAHWNQIAMVVEGRQERSKTARPAKVSAKTVKPSKKPATPKPKAKAKPKTKTAAKAPAKAAPKKKTK